LVSTKVDISKVPTGVITEVGESNVPTGVITEAGESKVPTGVITEAGESKVPTGVIVREGLNKYLYVIFTSPDPASRPIAMDNPTKTAARLRNRCENKVQLYFVRLTRWHGQARINRQVDKH
jgi:hypothetical protein